MKKLKLFIISLVFLLVSLLVSCSKNHYTFVGINGIIYAKGTQTVTISVSDDSTLFEKNLKPEYVTISEQLKGKTVESFTYISDTKAEVTLSGTLDVINTNVSYDYYELELSNKALKGNSTATVVLTVYTSSPKIFANSSLFITGSNAVSTFSLPYGEFYADYCNTQNISLPDANGEITKISVVDNKLTITVSNFKSTDSTKYPIVNVSKNCTSFDVDLSLYIGLSGYSEDLCK